MLSDPLLWHGGAREGCTDSRGVRWRQALEARRYALWNGLEAKVPMNAREAQVSLRDKFFHKPRQKAKNVSDLRHGLEVTMPRLKGLEALNETIL